MIDEKTFIKWSQRRQYQNNETSNYNIKISKEAEGLIHFKPNTYNVTLPKETKPCTLSFEQSVVYLKGNKRGSLKPLDNIKIMCEYCIIDLTDGAYSIPINIEAKTIVIKGADYNKKITDMYTIDQENDLYKTIINNLLKTNETLIIRDSSLNLGEESLNIKCNSLNLINSQIILPYNIATIITHDLNADNSLIDVQKEKITVYSDIACLIDTIISSAKPSEIEIGETLLKGNSQINVKQSQKSIK